MNHWVIKKDGVLRVDLGVATVGNYDEAISHFTGHDVVAATLLKEYCEVVPVQVTEIKALGN